jgi:hypothetical protein
MGGMSTVFGENSGLGKCNGLERESLTILSFRLSIQMNVVGDDGIPLDQHL